ncbi:hypothetical protein CMV_002456 [Castanea mollissima]|uniref:Uncharacterized protein n=1 Tax=Castanea mollissima TaxID=60419 RepID=A0A8J4VXI3_9ROSI|nr:hypothetical protein CMV_002456 [Castanea mollissima]
MDLLSLKHTPKPQIHLLLFSSELHPATYAAAHSVSGASAAAPNLKVNHVDSTCGSSSLISLDLYPRKAQFIKFGKVEKKDVKSVEIEIGHSSPKAVKRINKPGGLD